MTTYKNIRIPKRGGGTRLQRVQVLASGKYKFVKNVGGRTTKKKKSGSSKPTKKVTKTAKKKRRRGRRSIPLAPLIGLVGSAAEPIKRAMGGDWQGAIGEARNIYTGFNEQGKFNAGWLVKGWGPIVLGCLIHKFVGGWPINANRYLAGLPIKI